LNATGELALALICAYLLGSISGSMIIGTAKGVDIRTQGSGNAGATNALRTQGKSFALATAFIDVGKGAVAASLIAGFFNVNPMLTLFCAVLGHCFPIFYQFRGGKGASVAVGGLACVAPLLTLIIFAAWIFALSLSGYVGICTLLAAALAALLALADGARFNLADPLSQGMACGVFTLVIVMHHANIRRFLLGTEPRFERARWLHRFIQTRRP